MRYHGIGFWNLRQNELKGSFHHRAKRSHGHGQRWQVGIAYSFITHITLSLDYTCATLTTKRGKDTCHSRANDKKLQIPLRKVSAHSSEVRLGLGYAFWVSLIHFVMAKSALGTLLYSPHMGKNYGAFLQHIDRCSRSDREIARVKFRECQKSSKPLLLRISSEISHDSSMSNAEWHPLFPEIQCCL